MTRIFVVSFFFGFFFGYALKAFATEPQIARSQNHYSIGAGANSGGVSLSSSADPALSSSGTFNEAMAIGSLETPILVFDLGLGVFSTAIDGSKKSNSLGNSQGLSLNSYHMEKAGEVIHLGSRYRITDSFEAGVLAQLLFGTDVGFTPGIFDSGKSSAILAGIDVLYAFDFLRLRWKAGLRTFTSLGLEDSKLTAFEGVVQTTVPVL